MVRFIATAASCRNKATFRAPGLMDSNTRNRRVIPVALGVVLLAIVVAAGLSPNTGAVPAQGNCQYGQCVAGTGLQWWVLAAIVIIVVAALGAALFLMRRRRSPPRSGMAPPPPPGPTSGAMGGRSTPPPPPPAAAPAYLETPADVGRSLPSVPTGAPATAAVGGAAGAAGAGAGAAAGEGEPDIDSLMAELDKISGEILKRPKSPPDKTQPPSS
jgi:hypothetical protein